jgi:hypothetical protein
MGKWSKGVGLGATLHSVATLLTNVHKLNTTISTGRLISLTKNMTAKYRPKTAKPAPDFVSKQHAKLKIAQSKAAEILKKAKK